MTKTAYQLPQFARLEPRTEWTASRLADIDVLTLDDGARYATQHIGTEVTPGDFLRAAARGEITMHAVCPRTVTMAPCRTGDKPMHLPERSLPTLPLSACMGLANVGRADWRTYDGHERVEIFGGELCRFTQWQLPEGEPDLVTLPGDCRVTGRDVRALADAFRAPTAAGTTAPAAAELVALVADVAPMADDSPPPLKTSDIAFCFGGLGWSEDKWKKPLGDKPNWLSGGVAKSAVRGVSETMWDPVHVGAGLLHHKRVSVNSVRARFQSQPLLKPWLESWKTYEAEYIDTD